MRFTLTIALLIPISHIAPAAEVHWQGVARAAASYQPEQPAGEKPALDALEKDHAFLLKGDVFQKDLLETWIELKRKKEVDPVRLRPHPYEFFLYYDV